MRKSKEITVTICGNKVRAHFNFEDWQPGFHPEDLEKVLGAESLEQLQQGNSIYHPDFFKAVDEVTNQAIADLTAADFEGMSLSAMADLDRRLRDATKAGYLLLVTSPDRPGVSTITETPSIALWKAFNSQGGSSLTLRWSAFFEDRREAYEGANNALRKAAGKAAAVYGPH